MGRIVSNFFISLDGVVERLWDDLQVAVGETGSTTVGDRS